MRITKRTNFRVVVEVGSVDYYARPLDEVDMRGRAEVIKSEIKRHVDGGENAQIHWDAAHLCSFCGYKWGEEGTTYNGGCCAKDEENNPEGGAA